MKRVILATAIALAATGSAKADTILDDPLHGTICNASGAACNATEVGGVVPGNFAAGSTFGFNSSPAGATGELWISILVPTNELAGFVLPTLNSLGVDPGTRLFTASGGGGTFGATSPDLASFIFGNSITSSPANPENAFASPESIQDPGLTGFLVFAADVGLISSPGLNGQNDLTAPDFFTLSSGGLPPGSAITAFLVNGTTVTSTAPSGQISALSVTPVPAPIVGAGLPGLMGGVLLWLARRRQQRRYGMQS